MRPIDYTKKLDGKVVFHYKYADLKAFLKHGFAEGNNGWILMYRNDEFNTYRGFGTIENPCKHLITISMQHNPVYDGKLLTPEEIINPPKNDKPSMENYRWDILDFSK